ncbi:MAG: hypothetical protein WBQ25_05905, partial [Nitrososphaeraceae archaeon]
LLYHQTIADIDHVRAECWKLYHTNSDDGTSFFSNNNKKVTTKDRLQALRTILQADVARFELLSRGEVVMSVKSLNERIDAIKLAQSQSQRQQIRQQQQQPQTQRKPIV